MPLSHDIMNSEMEQAASWKAREGGSLASTVNTAELEARANDAFAASIGALKMTTGK